MLARVVIHVLARVVIHVLAHVLLHVLAPFSTILARVVIHVLARVLLHVLAGARTWQSISCPCFLWKSYTDFLGKSVLKVRGGLDNNSFLKKKQCTGILKACALEQFYHFPISRQFLYWVTHSCRIKGYSPCPEWFCTTKNFVVFLFLHTSPIQKKQETQQNSLKKVIILRNFVFSCFWSLISSRLRKCLLFKNKLHMMGLFSTVPGCTWLCPTVPGCTLAYHDLPFQRMPHSATDWPEFFSGLNAQKL